MSKDESSFRILIYISRLEEHTYTQFYVLSSLCFWGLVWQTIEDALQVVLQLNGQLLGLDGNTSG